MIKEVAYYKQEVKENEAKLAEMKQHGKDPYDIKHFENVLGESYMMVPDSTSRLERAFEDLTEFMAQLDGDTNNETKEKGEWYVAAKLLLKDNEAVRNVERDPILKTCVDDLADDEAF
jgi:Tubulin binding cofactor A